MSRGCVHSACAPVIVGVGQITEAAAPPTIARSPIQLIRDAAVLAARDSGAGEQLLRGLDSITVIRLFADSVARFDPPFGRMANPPWSLARRLGSSPSDLVYPPMGGDSPQFMLARACERIARGESRAALIAGGEALGTELRARRAGLALDWREDAPDAPQTLGPDRRMYSEHEIAHGMGLPIAMYALIGQALRAESRQSVEQYLRDCAQLLARFASVAKDNVLAARREDPSAEALATVTEDNPFIGFPYTKRMIANAYTNQSAALIVTSSGLADELGIAHERRVYLHASAHANDQWFVSRRMNLVRSHAMRLTSRHALGEAGVRLKDVSFFDFYSCFPSAVQIACREIGISFADERGLTVTGGLPFFGAPGNNYVTHAIAEMVQRLRERAGSWGLVMGNGGLVTKQAASVFSTVPSRVSFMRSDAALQTEIDREPMAQVVEQAQGDAVIETCSVLYGRSGPETGLVFGRLTSTGRRFLANVPADPDAFRLLQADEAIGSAGRAYHVNGRNLFVPRLLSARGFGP